MNKTYKQIKPLGDIPKGTVWLIPDGYKTMLHANGDVNSLYIDQELIASLTEYFEEIDPNTPKVGQKYWYIYFVGRARKENSVWDGEDTDRKYKDSGNFYLIESECDTMVEKINGMLREGKHE